MVMCHREKLGKVRKSNSDQEQLNEEIQLEINDLISDQFIVKTMVRQEMGNFVVSPKWTV